MTLEFWYSIIGIANIIILAIIGIYQFIHFLKNKRKLFMPNLEIDCQYPKGMNFKLIKKKDEFEWGILKFIITNTGSETAVINHLIFIMAKEGVNPQNVLGWDESIHVKEKDFIIGKEFFKGIISLPRIALPFSLKPQESITFFVIVRPSKHYLNIKEISAKFLLVVWPSRNKEITWGPINFYWASKEKIDEIDENEFKELLKRENGMPIFDSTSNQRNFRKVEGDELKRINQKLRGE
jgi:hypothetical protein